MALSDTARAFCDRYAPGAPEAVRADAAALMAAVLELHPAERGLAQDGQSVQFETRKHTDAFRTSGAARLLSPWRRPRAMSLGTD